MADDQKKINFDAAKELVFISFQQQQRYVYYTMALSVAVIGFSVHSTIGDPVNYVKIILMFAVLSLVVSIIQSLRFLQKKNNQVETNATALYALGEGNNQEHTRLDKEQKELKLQGNVLFKWQQRLQVLGLFLFLVWHVAEMIHSTINISHCCCKYCIYIAFGGSTTVTIILLSSSNEWLVACCFGLKYCTSCM